MRIQRAIIALLLLTSFGVALAQPVPLPGLKAVQHGPEMEGSGTNPAPLRLKTTCGTNEVLAWDGDSWECAGLSSGSVSGTGTNGKVARFSGATTIADGSISDNGSRAIVTDVRGTVLSPAAIEGATNDWAPTNLSTATILRVDSTATITLSGLTGGSDGRIIVLNYIGAHTLNLTNQDAASTAANRFITGTGATVALTQDQNAWLSYDGTTSRWRVISSGISTGDITEVAAGTGLSGGATSGTATLTVNIAGASCSAGSFVSALSATGTGTCTAEPGDISGVTAGTGLSGGGTSGAVSLSVNITGGTCSAGDFVSAVSSTGVATCGTPAGSGDITDVTAGAGLTGGASSGAATVDVGAGTNITVNANDVALATNVAVGGTLSVANGATTVSDFRGSTISPTISGTLNDWSPTGLSGATIIRASPSSTATITGITGGASGRILIIHNIGSQLLVVNAQDSGSTAANRIIHGNGLTSISIQVDQNIALVYDGTTSRWRSFAWPSTYSAGTNLSLSGSNVFSLADNVVIGASLTTAMFLGNVLNPTSISGTVNDWTPTGIATSMIIRIATSGTTTITGVGNGIGGRVLILHNISGNNITLANQSASSSAGTRMITGTGADITMAPDQSATMVFDTSTNRWRIIAAPSSGSGTVTSIATTAPISGGTITTSGTISLAACSTNQIYKYNGSAWACAADNDTDTTYTAGTNMSLSGGAFSLATNVTIGGTLNSTANTTTIGRWTGTTIAPSAIGGTVNNWSPTGASGATAVRISTSSAVDLTGLDAGNFGGRVRLINSGTHEVKIYNDNASSTASNRFLTPDARTWHMLAGSAIDFEYDTSSSRYRMVSYSLNYFPYLSVAGLFTATEGGNVSIVGPANTRGIEVDNVSSAQTSTVDTIWGRTGGTFNTTSSGITTAGVKGTATATRSSGSNSLVNVGVLGIASGAQENYAIGSQGTFIVADSLASGVPSGGALAAIPHSTNGGQVIVYGRVLDAGAAPSISSCGTSPSVAGGGSFGFRITVGSGTATSCTATFATAFSVTPTCTANSSDNSYVVSVITSTSSVTISAGGSNNMASDVLQVICVGDF